MATLTITTTPAQDARLGPAYGNKLGLRDAQGNPRSATVAEVKAYLILVLQTDVQSYERLQAELAIVLADFAPT